MVLPSSTAVRISACFTRTLVLTVGSLFYCHWTQDPWLAKASQLTRDDYLDDYSLGNTTPPSLPLLPISCTIGSNVDDFLVIVKTVCIELDPGRPSKQTEYGSMHVCTDNQHLANPMTYHTDLVWSTVASILWSVCYAYFITKVYL